MQSSFSTPDLNKLGQEGGQSRDSFDGDMKGLKGCTRTGDTRHAEMFVRDKLTTGAAISTSPFADIMPMAASKPQSKYDPNTGKFFRSVVVEPSTLPAALTVQDLMSLFCTADMLYKSSVHTGVVVNISSNITVTCVGDTHVHADGMYQEVQKRIQSLILGSSPVAQAAVAQAQDMETAMGMTLFNNGRGPAEKDCELVADSCAGISLFAPVDAAKIQIKAVRADTCCGMTMFSVEDDELSESETPLGTSPRSVSTYETLKQLVADTCAGMTLFSSSKPQVDLTNVVADTMLGQTLYSCKTQEDYDVHAETCNGITVFTKCAPAPVEQDEQDDAVTNDTAFSSVCGFTDFSPALRKLQQDPSTYTKEQQFLSDLAWAAAY